MLLLAPLFGWRPRDFLEAGPEAAGRPAVALGEDEPGKPA
jgi:hypothetical protein